MLRFQLADNGKRGGGSEVAAIKGIFFNGGGIFETSTEKYLAEYGKHVVLTQDHAFTWNRACGRPAPVIFEQALHRFGHALVFKDHRGPGGFGNHRIHQRQQSAAAVHYGHLHRYFFDLPDLNAGVFVLGQETLVCSVEGAAFHDHAATDAARAGL